ncbi:MAG TPA: hypothetical protein DEQ80_06980 [Anaerolinea thermolimosa]|uniref:Response regulatory domain-containing protein n=1 Tax=Anaerolinea thermolimosa TaxID=229919 RepID=A0A3D1JIY4_9CHLR|nr:hypothetical protein [Anaerolinea thermolimosa]
MPHTCLIAAHDPWFIQLLRIFSEESGVRVVQAFEGQDVLPLALQEKPAIVFLQIDLPGQVMGQEVLKLLKRNSATAQIPVFAFSWRAQERLDEIIGDLTGYLQEPITYEAFVDALAKAGVHYQVRGSEGRDQLQAANRSTRMQSVDHSGKGQASGESRKAGK